ncbi:MAG TPA: hypothetical protein VMI75_28510 [Polyangiaceae bacterium]|nr:hypothetical protein [Polyangiaceae bacterium]
MKDESSAAMDLRTEDRAYGGPERRRHRVYVTRNTEYHFRDGFCIAVRDRRSGDFLHGHLALQRRVHGGLKFFPDGGIAPNAGEPKAGESLYFAAEGRDLVTSPLEAVERPSKELVGAYPGRKR